MLTVDDYARIRRAHRDGMTIREIARTFHHSRRKVREALAHAEPRKYTRQKEPYAPKLEPFKAIVRQILAEDEQAPPKQRHTAMRIFERLRDEHGYPGGYDSVRRYIGRLRNRKSETFIPLAHDPGQRLEADFGQIYVDFPEGRTAVSVLVLVWSYSNCPFAIALPTQRTEAILEGMVQGFEFFGCIPREVWWDNPKTVTPQLLSGRERRLNPRYAALASHYVFEPLFCLPARGNEKPYVENRVKSLQRRWATPVPKVQDLSELNEYLRDCCLNDRRRTTGRKEGTVGERFAQDRAAAASLPRQRFDPCISRPAKVDKYQLVRFDGVCYSVPRQYAFTAVTVKATTERVQIVAGEQTVATHRRSYQSGDQVLDPLHYLVTLGRRPAALDHSPVYRRWKLPSVFEQLRTRLEARHGSRSGVRQFVRVLQLLAEHPLARVEQVLRQCRRPEDLDAERIARGVRLLAAGEDSRGRCAELSEQRPEVMQVRVPCPELTHFDQFLSRGDDHDDPEPGHAAEGQPEAPAAADDRGRVRETGPRGGRCEPDLRGVPAPADRTGGRRPIGERPGGADPAGRLPGREAPGGVRLLRHALAEQAEGPGTGPR